MASYSNSDRTPSTVAECLAADYVVRHTAGLSPNYRGRHVQIAATFRRFLSDRALLTVDETAVDAWVLHRLQRAAAATVWLELYCLRHILDVLAQNPIAQWMARHPRLEKRLIEWKATLPVLTVPPQYNSMLAADIHAFVSHKRRLGRKYTRTELMLRSFDRFLKARDVGRLEDIDGRLLQDFAASLGHLKPSTRSVMLQALRRLFHFLRRNGRITATPDAVLRPKRVRRPRQPYIFTLKELTMVLETIRNIGTWDAQTLFAALRLIYACGLRLGEAVHLRVQDVDLEARTLWIHRTKFGKSRHIPIGPRSSDRLAAYLQSREQRFGPAASHSPFFVNQRGKAVIAARLQEGFRPVCQQMGLNPHGPVPRVHDLRHCFALHRLYKWYAEGYRPQDKLVLLSLYMGHVDLRYTEHYLQRSTDLLRMAGAACGRQLDDFLMECRRLDV